MSLLMDALRKAEREKKAAAKRLEEGQGRGEKKDPSGPDDEHRCSPTLADGKAENGAGWDSAFTLLSLATEEDRSAPEGDTPSAETTVIRPDLQIERLSEGRQVQAGQSGVATGNDHSRLFQETLQAEAYVLGPGHDSLQQTLPGVSAIQFAKDVGEENAPAPVTAHTVFAAVGTVSKRTLVYKWLLAAAAVLVIVAVGAGYYYSITPTHRALPAPPVVNGIEPVPPAQLQAPTTGQAAAKSPGEWASGDEHLPQEDGVEATGAAELSASADSEGVMAMTEQETAAGAEQDIELSDTESHAKLQDTGAADPLPPTGVEPLNSFFRISRGRPDAETGHYLHEAYLAYQTGKFELAGQMYTEVLAEFPDNRDALLGLAAIALNGGEKRKAVVLYTEILRLNPQDSIARTMLMNLHDESDPPDRISRITSMLYQNPEQPILYFTLGNLYAGQGRWAAAQQAFFAACRLDSSNPDYVFNLAVSLDHIGRHETALDYYNVALKLADERAVHFDPAALLKRINRLNIRN